MNSWNCLKEATEERIFEQNVLQSVIKLSFK